MNRNRQRHAAQGPGAGDNVTRREWIALLGGATLGGALATYNLPLGAGTATIESKTNFLRAAPAGTYTATTTAVHVGRTTIVAQTDITRADGKLVTRTTQTQAIIPAR